MSRIVPLWRSDALSVHRFDHPAEHEDRPYEEVSTRFMASFVEAGAKVVEDARTQKFVYEHQVEDPGTQTVRLYGDGVAMVTARLWLKGRTADKTFDRRLWFSDTYVKTKEGWKYAFGQASLPLPAADM
jgi:hypothetical protein